MAHDVRRDIGASNATSERLPSREGVYTDDEDAYYRALWEEAPTRPADRTFDAYRPAYQLGHFAAQHPDYLGRDFDAAEPDLRRTWETDFRARHGEWDTVRRHVHDAYGHARSLGYGVRRVANVIGTAGSAVDPVELERARAGRPSVDTPVAGEAMGDGTIVHPDDEVSIVQAEREGHHYR
jgi:hypothetical protein